MSSQLRRVAKALFLEVHRLALRLHLTIVPNHYYSPVADVRDLEVTKAVWAKRSPMLGIEVTDLKQQLAKLLEMVKPFKSEYEGSRMSREAESSNLGLGFGFIEAQCLHGVLRSLKPKRMIEIGSGVSTHWAINAMSLNALEQSPGTIICIEPYPSKYLLASKEIELIPKMVQELDPVEFDSLEAGDLLLIDSSHAVRTGGDVIYIYLQVLPRLKPGVIVHIHDIYFPYLYQRDILDALYQWNETALLAAYLTNNSAMIILFSLSMLHYDASDELKKVFPDYEPAIDVDGLANKDEQTHFPSSIYLITQ